MTFRFRKSFKVLPGVKINFSKSGTSLSAGRRGNTVNVGRKGMRHTVGIPGSGISYISTHKTNGAAIGFTVVALMALGYFALRLFF